MDICGCCCCDGYDGGSTAAAVAAGGWTAPPPAELPEKLAVILPPPPPLGLSCDMYGMEGRENILSMEEEVEEMEFRSGVAAVGWYCCDTDG